MFGLQKSPLPLGQPWRGTKYVKHGDSGKQAQAGGRGSNTPGFAHGKQRNLNFRHLGFHRSPTGLKMHAFRAGMGPRDYK